jgi:hypothetical protein
MDTSTRRPSLIAKSGRGLTEDQFRAGVASGRVGHKGLDSSARLIARGLEWPYHDVTVDIRPIRDGSDIVGAHHRAVLNAGEGRIIELVLDMAWGLDDEIDRIEITGDPPIDVTFPEGYPVDEGTAALVITALRHLDTLSPGFYRPTDIPLRFGAG